MQKYKDEEELSRRSGHEKLLFGQEFDRGKLFATCPSDRPLGDTAPQMDFLMRKKVYEEDVEHNRSRHDVLNDRTITKTERDESLQETVGRMLDEYDYEDNEESKLIKLQKETSSFRFLACSTSDPGRVQINYVTGMSVTVGVERSSQPKVTDAEVSGFGHVGVGQEEHLLRQRDVTGDDNGSLSLLQANGNRNEIAKPLQSQVQVKDLRKEQVKVFEGWNLKPELLPGVQLDGEDKNRKQELWQRLARCEKEMAEFCSRLAQLERERLQLRAARPVVSR